MIIIKTRNESIKEFEKGGRTDLVEQTQNEIDVLKNYLPEQLSEEEVDSIIDEVFNEVDEHIWTSPINSIKIIEVIIFLNP